MILNRLYALILGACLLLGLGAGTVWYLMHDAAVLAKAKIVDLTGQIKQAQEAAAHDRAVLASLAQENAALARKQASVRLSAMRALAQNHQWAETPIPQEVQDALSAP
jgi:hypothetical protein